MKFTDQMSNKVDILFEKFLEDKEIFDKNSFFEKLISFGINNNFQLNSKHMKFLCYLSLSIEAISLFFLGFKARLIKRMAASSVNAMQVKSIISPADTEQIKWAIIIFAVFGIVLMITILCYMFMKMVADQKSSREIMMVAKKKYLQKSLCHYENLVANNFKITSKQDKENIKITSEIDNFVVESLLTHFQYLIRKTDKIKDSTDACIPLITLIFVLISVFVIGIPSIPGFDGQLSPSYGLPTFAAFIAAIFKPTLVLTSNNLSMKYSKCLLKMEDLKYRKNMSQVKIDETLRLLS
jgi:hypothetical protein